jgi:nucleoprotein TPR
MKKKAEEDAQQHAAHLERNQVELKEYHAKYEAQMSLLYETREQLSLSKTFASQLKTKVDELESELAAAKRKLDVYQTRPAHEQTEGERTSELQGEVAELRGQVETLQIELKRKEEHVQQFVAISEAAEAAHKEMQATYDQYKLMMEAKLKASQTQIAELEATRDTLLATIATLQSEMQQREQQQQQELEQVTQQRDALHTKIERVEEAERTIDTIKQKLQDDVKLHARLAQESHERYNQELVAHARDVSLLAELRENSKKLEESCMHCKSEAEKATSMLATSQSSWQSQKELLQRSMEDLEKKCRDLEELNNRLHADYDHVKVTASKLQESLSLGMETTEFNEDAAQVREAVENLRGVVNLLRNENTRVRLEKELSQQEARRLQQELQLAQQAADQARAALQAA